jgi:hypothetical protein
MASREEYARWIVANPDKRGTPEFETVSRAYQAAKSEPTVREKTIDELGGLVRGAGSIGATLLTPFDMLAGNTQSIGNPERRKAMDDALASLGVNTDSGRFKATKLTSEVLGSAGVPAALAKPLAGVAPALSTAIQSGGFLGGKTLPAWALRALGGGVAGGASAGLVDPEIAQTGAVLGGALPAVAKAGGAAGDLVSRGMTGGAKRLMQSALKPTIKDLKSGDAATAVDVLLERGINPNTRGVEKLQDAIDGLNSEISSKIARSGATVGRSNVIDRAWETRGRFQNQVNPLPDTNAIDAVIEGFYFHPKTPPGDAIPVQLAQELKRGTYQTLSKKYGQLGSAETEAQKALARGLKEEIAGKVPEISALNAEESRLIKTLNVTERRALMEMNKNPMGLAALSANPKSWALFMADKSAAFKALAARALNAASQARPTGGLLLNAPAVRAGLLTVSEDSP